MITVTILYPRAEGVFFDADYYFNVHLPLSINRQGERLKGVLAEKGLSMAPEGTAPLYLATCHFVYESFDSFLAAFQPHQEKLTADMKNYTDIRPLIQISEVRTDWRQAAEEGGAY